MTGTDFLGAKPVVELRVPGAPFQWCDVVRVVSSEEGPNEPTNVIAFIGRVGTVEYLEYSCGCGQRYPDDPMIGVKFDDGTVQEFWRDELSLEPS